ncbi:MAG: alanine--tRNA ligase [Proteobacteria bacterium]|nr:alanine--tRNA ligase [Pseudomonadota bacterium]
MKTVNDIRSEFLSFFNKRGHEVMPSSSLVPHNDPTLMFTNAGMNQFKDVFTGKETRGYKRAASSQKCVRAGGKHNDLENVGYTARHHTFFEMLGNFSFGDYFKEEAISFAWELVTKNFGLPKEKLLVTVHSSDEEAATLWKKIAGFSDDKVIRIPTDDNFWSMGDTGPCGPCTEIFIDQGDKLQGGPPGSPDQDGDRFLEFWNNVFMQFEKLPNGSRVNLPAPSVDTGMGLERISAIMQGKLSNYDIDLLRKIIEHSADLTGVSPDGPQSASHRVIADHLRAAAFLMADGVMPANDGRGYVLRRIMRRGMRHAHILGAKDPLMYRLAPTLVSMMGDAYPELRRAESLVTEMLKLEETRFRKTLDRGLKLLDEESANVKSGGKLPGDVAFKLYDTFGFPVDLTQDAMKAKGIAVDMAGFEQCMERQRAEARKNWAGSGAAATDKLWFDLLEEYGPTDFLGYKNERAEGKILALVQDGKRVDVLKAGETGTVIANQTPFYGESGGQVGDHGEIRSFQNGNPKPGIESVNRMMIGDTRKQIGKLFLHIGKVLHGSFRQGDTVQMSIDTGRRDAIRANHSATHLLHAALREKLGSHVTQKGSIVDAGRLRFDFAHPKAMTADEIKSVESRVNEEIRANTEVLTRLMPVEEAIESGAMALFGEKYDDEVRVLTMGAGNAGNKDMNRPFSVELCGGTHVRRTGDIGLLKIISESAVSAGVRRIEAVTGTGALDYFEEQERILLAAAAALKAPPADVPERVKALSEERKKLEQEVSNLRRQLATGGASGGASSGPEVKTIAGVKFSGRVLDGFPAKDLKPMVDDLKKKIGSGVITLIATDDGKASIVVGVTDDLTGKYSAVDLVKKGVEALGGKGGGGRPDMAQGGGPNAASANDAVTAIENALAS